jgi:chromosome segregation ATPase
VTRAARLGLILGLSGALLIACSDDRAQALHAEITKLKGERVPKAQLETGHREADEAEAAREAAVAGAHEAESAAAAASAEAQKLRGELDHEAARNAELRGALDAQSEPLAQLGAKVDALDARAVERGRHLALLRDQALALAAALRPDDPAWAEERRLAAVRDFERKLRGELPNEPAVGELARALDAQPSQPQQLEVALRTLAALLDRNSKQSESHPATP